MSARRLSMTWTVRPSETAIVLLGDVEAQERRGEMVQEGHADAILSRLASDCVAWGDQRPNQLSKRWRKTAGTLMTGREGPQELRAVEEPAVPPAT